MFTTAGVTATPRPAAAMERSKSTDKNNNDVINSQQLLTSIGPGKVSSMVSSTIKNGTKGQIAGVGIHRPRGTVTVTSSTVSKQVDIDNTIDSDQSGMDTKHTDNESHNQLNTTQALSGDKSHKYSESLRANVDVLYDGDGNMYEVDDLVNDLDESKLSNDMHNDDLSQSSSEPHGLDPAVSRMIDDTGDNPNNESVVPDTEINALDPNLSHYSLKGNTSVSNSIEDKRNTLLKTTRVIDQSEDDPENETADQQDELQDDIMSDSFLHRTNMDDNDINIDGEYLSEQSESDEKMLLRQLEESDNNIPVKTSYPYINGIFVRRTPPKCSVCKGAILASKHIQCTNCTEIMHHHCDVLANMQQHDDTLNDIEGHACRALCVTRLTDKQRR